MSRPHAETDPSDVMPAEASLWHLVTKTIRAQGRPEGWATGRDLLLDGFPYFEKKMGAYQTLKAALEVDRHAMFAEVQAQAAEGQFNRDVWQQFQQYMAGEIDEAPLKPTVRAGAAAAGVDAPELDDDEPDEETEEA